MVEQLEKTDLNFFPQNFGYFSLSVVVKFLIFSDIIEAYFADVSKTINDKFSSHH